MIKYYWKIIMRNGNSYYVESEVNNIEEFIKNSFIPVSQDSFAVFTLHNYSSTAQENKILIRYSEISEILWNDIRPKIRCKMGRNYRNTFVRQRKGDSVNSIDYDISFYSDGCWFRETYSEEHIVE